MRNPFELLGNLAWPTLIVAGIAMALLFTQLSKYKAKLRTTAAPQGIVSFALCGSAQRSQAIIDSWKANEANNMTDMILYARQSLRLDFFFIVAYVVALGLFYGWLSSLALGIDYQTLRCLFCVLAWLQIVAGVLDVTENVCLLKILSQGTVTSSVLPRTAYLCATLKFVLTGIGVGIPLYTAFTEGF